MDVSRKLNQLALIRRITGDPYWGRTVRECPECAGSGRLRIPADDESDLAVPPRRDCDFCLGYGVVFREWLPCPNCVGDVCNACDDKGRIPDTRPSSASHRGIEGE